MPLLFSSLQQSQLSLQTRVERRSCAPSNDAPISGRHVSQRGYNPIGSGPATAPRGNIQTPSCIPRSLLGVSLDIPKTITRRSKMPVLPAPPLHDKSPFVVLSDWVSSIILSSSGRN